MTNDDDEETITVESNEASRQSDARRQKQAGDQPAGDEPEPDEAERSAKPETKDSKPEPEAVADDDGKLPPGVEKRLAREKARRLDAEKRANELEARLEKLEKAGPDEEPPDANDFETFEELEAAEKAYKERQKAKKAKDAKKAEDEAPKLVATPELKAAVASLKEHLATADPDLWLKVMDEKALQITPEAVIAVEQSDVSHRILRHIYENPEVQVQFLDLHGVPLAREIAKLELKFAERGDDGKFTPKKRTSTAPAPITPVSDRATPSEPTLAELVEGGDYAAFEKRRNDEEEKRQIGGWN